MYNLKLDVWQRVDNSLVDFIIDVSTSLSSFVRSLHNIIMMVHFLENGGNCDNMTVNREVFLHKGIQ